jgi:hypothetical protein
MGSRRLCLLSKLRRVCLLEGNKSYRIVSFGRTHRRFGSHYGFTTRAVLVSVVDWYEQIKAGFARDGMALRWGRDADRYRGRTPSRLIPNIFK